MARTTAIQTAFLAGETSGRLLARVDLDTYKYACKTLTNGLPFYHGGVARRPGTVWVEVVRDSTNAVKMMPFVYSRTQSYVAVFNDGFIQFIKNGDFIRFTPFQEAEFTVPKAGGDATGLANDATVYTATVAIDGGAAQPIAITGSTAQTFTTLVSELNADTTGAVWSISAGGNVRCTSDTSAESSDVVIADTDLFSTLTNFSTLGTLSGPRYEITHTYTDDELNEIRFAQFGNTVYITHPLHAPAVLTRISDTSWTITSVAFIHRALSDFWYENSYVRLKLINGSTTFLAGDDFASVVTGGVAGAPSDPGAANTGNGVMVISALTGAPDETWTVTCVYADSLRQEWTVSGSVSGEMIHTFKANNYPTAITFYQQRMWLAGTPSEPQQIWSSAVNDFTNLTVGTDDSDGMLLQLASSSNDLILHLSAGSANLLVHSYANEFAIDSTSGVYTPSTIVARPQTSHGSNLVAPLRIGHDVVFCQRDSRRIRSIAYDIEKSANVAKDLTVVSEHITEGSVIDAVFQQDPDYVVWLTRADGVMLSLTYLDEQDVVAWAKHTTDGDFLSLCTIPEANSDKTYVVVERVINSVTVKYIEWIDYELQAQTDCAIFGTNGSPITVWSGLDHLEGETVTIVADGSVHVPLVVTSGSITLLEAAEDIEIGLPFTTAIELLHPNPEVQGGTAQGRQVSMHEIILRLQDTVGCRVNGVEIPFLAIGDPFDTAPELFTGDKKVTATGWRSPNNILIEQVLPRPFTLLGVIMKLSVND